jgi:hypothetical protein
VRVPPGGELALVEDDWMDTLVVVASGSVELETRCARRLTLVAGDVAFLAGLSLRLIRNRGRTSALLDTVRRRRPQSDGSMRADGSHLTTTTEEVPTMSDAPISHDDVRGLVRGAVIGPGDPEYDAARAVF